MRPICELIRLALYDRKPANKVISLAHRPLALLLTNGEVIKMVPTAIEVAGRARNEVTRTSIVRCW